MDEDDVKREIILGEAVLDWRWRILKPMVKCLDFSFLSVGSL